MPFLLIGIYLGLSTTHLWAQQLVTTFEKSNFTATSTYEEGMAYYTELAKQFDQVKLIKMGPTDSGKPLHLVLISKSEEFDITEIKNSGKAILLINNAIHPGEPDGVEASQMMARDLLKKKKLSQLLDNTVVAIIPFYNIGGVLNRNNTSRVNQDGPVEYGFRGNARNFDLNRDFIKNDTRNAESFAEIFHLLDPDVLIDTHVSNGADYQYTLTMVYSQKDKLGEPLGDYMNNQMMPSLYKAMSETPYEMTPYVNVWGSTPDKGWNQFFDGPRYSSGYAALFQTIAFQSETHMLKPFDERVWATYYFLESVLGYLDKEGKALIQTRIEAKSAVAKQYKFPITWEIDKSTFTTLKFKGYRPTQPMSAVSGQSRLKYDHAQPFEQSVPYYDTYKPVIEIIKPDYYIVPQAWHSVIDRLILNGVDMEKIEQSTNLRAEVYYIDDYSSGKSPWEGHYFHNEVKIKKVSEMVKVQKGDYRIPVNQANNRYIIETLEPEATDSFFRWNFFDSILQMKEGYSSYVFEDLAIELLNENPELKNNFEAKKQSDAEFADNSRAQLRYIYMNSEHYEEAHLRYPIYRFTLLD